jgi:hypothetical protein|eukprot:COSAG01_NODE_2215_length_8133_cov_7.016880_3_plen_40_part_00
MAIEEQADALNAEARELNRKKKQIKAMKQEVCLLPCYCT